MTCMTSPSRASAAHRLDVERTECVILHVPQWFERSDFLDWRQGRAPGQWQGPACWNPGQRVGDHNDVFVVFDRRLVDDTPGLEPDEPFVWDGTDITGLPDDIYEAIGIMLHRRKLRYGLLWLTDE